MKKLTLLLFMLILLTGGAWLTLKYAPDAVSKVPFLQSYLVSKPTPLTVSPTQYLLWRDSLDQTDLLIRQETDPQRIKMLKDRQSYFWNQLQAVRKQLQANQNLATSNQNKKSTTNNDKDFINFLIKVLSITAIVLLGLIIFLYLLLKRKKAVLTKHIETIQEDPRFKGVHSGLNTPTARKKMPSTAKPLGAQSPNNIPPTRALDLSNFDLDAESPPTHQGLRPTAKQRVTMALQGLAEALGTLKSDPTQKPIGVPRPGNHNKVPSPHIFKPTQANTIFSPSKHEQDSDDSNEVLKLSRRGFTPSEIARRLRIPQDKVEMIVRLHRE